MTGAHFSHLALTVRDLEQQAEFYSAAFGCTRGNEYLSRGRRVATLMEVAPSGFRGVFLRLDDFYLELLEYVDLEPATPPRSAAAAGFAHISLVVPDVRAALSTVLSAGGSARQTLDHSFTGGDTATRIAFCLDPEGNRIELIEHPDDAEAGEHATFLGLGSLGWPAADRS